MRRGLTIAAFVILAGLVSASAQRGGLRASGGGRGVAVGHVSGGQSFGGMHASPRAGMGARSSPSFRTPPFRRGGVDRGRFGGHRFHHCFGCRRAFGNPWFSGFGYAGYYDPYWWWDSSSSYNDDEAQDRELALANEMNSVNLEEQRLRDEEDRDRERNQNSYARRPRPREEEQAAAVGPATALVFRDQHVEEVRNYAIAGGTLWVLNDHQVGKKIPIAQLDLPATVKMNDDRGVDFQVPR
jgi:hypothetical protein